MKTIRRLYIYLVAFITIEIITWGVISLLRGIVDQTVSGGADALAQALALILVGVPIFLVHWLWTQSLAAKDNEEKESTLRAVFLYGILLATLVPVVQNLLSFIDRLFVRASGLGVERAFTSFREQTLADNLIAIAVNLIVAAYFWNVLRSDWLTLNDKHNFSDVRRLYRYIWMLYGLLMTLFGAQQVLRFIFYIPSDVLGAIGREVLINGLALLAVGTPIWIYSWRVIQDSLTDPAEMNSNLRLGILYLLALGGVITVVTTISIMVNTLIAYLFGSDRSTVGFVQDMGGPISVGVPMAVVWAYYGYWLNRHIEAIGDKVRQAGMKRLYNYILAFIGLVMTFIGIATLISFIIDMSTSRAFLSGDANLSGIATALSLLVVGLPLWLMTWRPMQAEALALGEMGDHARRSLIRRSYLYIVLFASVIGGMASAVALVYQILRTVLTGNTGSMFVNELLNTIQLLFLFVMAFLYHWNVLRADGTSVADALGEKQSAFSALIVDSGDGFAESVRAALVKQEAKVQVTVTSPNEKPQGDFNTLIIDGRLAATGASAWIQSFGGSRIVIENEAGNIVWAEDVMAAAESAQRMAEGQEIQKKRGTTPAWMYVVYVFAALFALELLFILLMLGMSLVTRF
jgi:hypothetical protein